MKIVSENSEEDLERERARAEVQYALRELTANLLRVTRGAGRAYEIGRQAQELIDSLDAYFAAVSHYPPGDELANALDIDATREDLQRFRREDVDRIYAERSMIRGALQIAASRLLGQRTQERAGDSELDDGLRQIERIHEKAQAARAAAMQKRPKPARAAKKRAKPEI